MPSLRSIVSFFSSQRLTVVILLLLAALTWLGTLAQVSKGIYQVQKEYFESVVAVADLPLDNPFTGRPLAVPLPGAYLLLALLAVNLVTGGIIGLKKGTRTAGILVVHLGVLLLLAAGFIKLNFSSAGHLSLYEGRSSSQYQSFHEYELVLLHQVGDEILERALPASAIEHAAPGHPVQVAGQGLPFSIEVTHYFPQCEPMRKGPMFEVKVPVVDGNFLKALPPAKEREFQIAGCYANVVEATGKRIPVILWGVERRPTDDARYPFTFESNGTVWGLDLRRVTWDLPFQVRLKKFTKRDRPGSSIVAEFSSDIIVKEGGSEREQHITMNAPLRQGGLVFYQTNWGPQPPGSGPPWYSVFEVSRNPSDRWEIYACAVIALGLLFHFLRKLFGYIRGETAKAAAEAS
jgi:ResB-like family